MDGNALTLRMRRSLAEAIRHSGDGQRADGIVVAGEGRAFSAGKDLGKAAEFTLCLDNQPDVQPFGVTLP